MSSDNGENCFHSSKEAKGQAIKFVVFRIELGFRIHTLNVVHSNLKHIMICASKETIQVLAFTNFNVLHFTPIIFDLQVIRSDDPRFG